MGVPPPLACLLEQGGGRLTRRPGQTRRPSPEPEFQCCPRAGPRNEGEVLRRLWEKVRAMARTGRFWAQAAGGLTSEEGQRAGRVLGAPVEAKFIASSGDTLPRGRSFPGHSSLLMCPPWRSPLPACYLSHASRLASGRPLSCPHILLLPEASLGSTGACHQAGPSPYLMGTWAGPARQPPSIFLGPLNAHLLPRQ